MVDFSTTCQLPSVTEDDLRNFHAEHFPSNPHPRNFFHGYSGAVTYGHANNYDGNHGVENESQENGEGYGDGDGDDDLGYYPDGVKRTLTEEQIAIFRHTEIEMLLKEKRREREEEEEEEEEGKEEKQEQEQEQGQEGKARSNVETELDTEMNLEIDVDVGTNLLVDGNQKNQKGETLEELHPTLPKPVGENLSGNGQAPIPSATQVQPRKKRSWTKRTINKDGEGKERLHVEEEGNVWNFRRRARELDEKEEHHVELDY